MELNFLDPTRFVPRLNDISRRVELSVSSPVEIKPRKRLTDALGRIVGNGEVFREVVKYTINGPHGNGLLGQILSLDGSESSYGHIFVEKIEDEDGRLSENMQLTLKRGLQIFYADEVHDLLPPFKIKISAVANEWDGPMIEGPVIRLPVLSLGRGFNFGWIRSNPLAYCPGRGIIDKEESPEAVEIFPRELFLRGVEERRAFPEVRGYQTGSVFS